MQKVMVWLKHQMKYLFKNALQVITKALEKKKSSDFFSKFLDCNPAFLSTWTPSQVIS